MTSSNRLVMHSLIYILYGTGLISISSTKKELFYLKKKMKKK